MLEQIELVAINNIIKKEYLILSEKQSPYVETLYQKYKNQLDIKIVQNTGMGVNFVFNGLGSYNFPGLLWESFSYQNSKNEIKSMLEIENLDWKKFQYDIYTLLWNNKKTKSGISNELLETLYFSVKFVDEFINAGSDNFIYKYKLKDYKPIYLPELTEKIFFNHLHKAHSLLIAGVVPNYQFWNLGEILIDPTTNNQDSKLPLFPLWLATQENNKPLFIIHRISTDKFTKNFGFKDNIVDSIEYSISFNYYSKKRRYNTHFMPNLFNEFDLFENQGYTYIDNQDSNENSVHPPNWSLSIKIPTNPSNIIDTMDKLENEDIIKLKQENLDSIIHLYNTFYNSNSDFDKIFVKNKLARKNIFDEMFYRRIYYTSSLDLTEILIWITSLKNRQLKIISKIIALLKTTFPTGTIIKYKKGIVIWITINKEYVNRNINQLHEFLQLFSLEYQIYTNFVNHGLKTYNLPPSLYWNNGQWNLPERSINTSIEEFKKISPLINELEEKFIANELLKKKYTNFKNIIEKI